MSRIVTNNPSIPRKLSIAQLKKDNFAETVFTKRSCHMQCENLFFFFYNQPSFSLQRSEGLFTAQFLLQTSSSIHPGVYLSSICQNLSYAGSQGGGGGGGCTQTDLRHSHPCLQAIYSPINLLQFISFPRFLRSRTDLEAERQSQNGQ